MEKVVELAISAENTFSDELQIGGDFVFSLISASFVGTAVLQRRFNPADVWRNVDSYSSTSVEKNGVGNSSFYRVGVETGAYTSGTVTGRIGAVAN